MYERIIDRLKQDRANVLLLECAPGGQVDPPQLARARPFVDRRPLDRPLDDERGLLLEHLVGLELRAEKAAALLTVEYLEERGRRADPKLVDRILNRVPDVPPDPGDELPVRPRQSKRLHPPKARDSSGRSKRSRARPRG